LYHNDGANLFLDNIAAKIFFWHFFLAMAETTSTKSQAKEYWYLVRDNAGFRFIWFADIISQFGDW
jgi:hypothetical protein